MMKKKAGSSADSGAPELSRTHSGLEAWRYIRDIEGGDNHVDIAVPIVLAVAGSLGILPFAVYRFMQGNYIVGVIDSLLIAGMLLLGTYVYRTQKVRMASVTLSILAVIGLNASVYASGTGQVMWAFPAIVGIFYLLRPGEAITLVLLMIAALLPAFLGGESDLHTASVFITLVVMSVFAYSFAAVNNRQRQLLMRQATKDPLTGVGNRRALEFKLAELTAAFARHPAPSSLIILDLDHFKQVNDLHGHVKGDEILKRITEIVNLRIRVTDSLYRIGGEEFVVVAEHQDVERASHLAEQLRTLVEANELVPDYSVTISLGVAEIGTGERGSEWLHRADEALYEAKRTGRNATAIARPRYSGKASVASI